MTAAAVVVLAAGLTETLIQQITNQIAWRPDEITAVLPWVHI